MVTADEPISTLYPYLLTTQIHITTIERPEFGPQDQKSALSAVFEDTEREAGPELARQKCIT